MSGEQISSERWWDFSAAVLLLAALITSGTRLVATEWTDHLSIIQTVVFFGVIAGLALGCSRFSARSVRFIAAIYGLFIIPWQLGKTLSVELSWLEKMIVLINRLGIIFAQLSQDQPVKDSLLFLIAIFSVYWGLSTYSGYTLTRRGDPWLAVLPAGLGLFLIHVVHSAMMSKISYLGIYIFLSLILIARMTYLQRRRIWQENRSAVPPHISFDLIRFTIIAAFLIVAFAWTIPALAKTIPQANRLWRPVQDAWQERVSEFENAFASLRASMFAYSAVYGHTSTLGRGAPRDDTQIFTAKAPLDIPLGARLYWRARVYNFYEDSQWQSTLDSTSAFNPDGSDLPIEIGENLWTGRFTIISSVYITTLFTPAQPQWVSRSGQIEFAKNPDRTIDISSFSADPPIGYGERYEVDASIGNPTISQLMAAGSNYPEWIQERYLQLPETITPRTRELAREITADLKTPYEKAAAITAYLRSSIQYVEVLEDNPPSDQDSVDWFLFDIKQGFCNYYATAQIVLLRSIGIPARYILGYAEGDLLDDTGTNFIPTEFTYIIRHRDAHAWPEVYFPGIGWIEFEPTSSQPDIQRPLSAEGESDMIPLDPLAEDQQPSNGSDDGSDSDLVQGRNSWVEWVASIAIIALAVLLFLLIGFLILPLLGIQTAPRLLKSAINKLGMNVPGVLGNLADESASRKEIKIPPLPVLIEKLMLKYGRTPPEPLQRWARQAEMPVLSRSYLEINRALKISGHPPELTETPFERASMLGRLLPPAEEPASVLVQQYQIGIFSRQEVDLQKAQNSARLIRKLAYLGLLKRWLQRFQKPDQSISSKNSG